MDNRIFIVCFEIENVKSQKAFEKFITTHFETQNIMQNVYLVKTDPFMESEKLRDIIFDEIGYNRSIFVMRASIDVAWNLPANLDTWINCNI